MSVIERTEQTEVQVLDPRVEEGARMMDKVFPGWADRIDLGDFNINSSQKCVLAQACRGGFSIGIDILRDKGFDLPDTTAFYSARFSKIPDLNGDWRLAIQARKTR